MPESETGTGEVQQLRRCIRDLVALSAFPAVCVGYGPLRIAESLADVLRHMLNLDFIYLAVGRGADGVPVEVAHTSRGPAPPDRVQVVRTALDPWLRAAPSGIPSTIPEPLGTGTIPIVLTPFGFAESSGVLVAGSRRAGYPTEIDRLLLRVGANQVGSLLGHRRAEEALRESEERFRGTFENAAVGIVHSDQEGRWLRINRKLCDILGYTPEELLGRAFAELTHPADLPANLELFGSLMQGALSDYSHENRYIRKDGSLFWGEVTASLERDAEGRPAYCIAIVQDISERRRLEADLREAKEAAEAAGARVTRILESITDAFYALDRDWRFTYINPQAELQLRKSRDELLGKVVWDEFPTSVGSTFDRIYHEALATGRSVTFEEYYPPLGTWFEVRAYPSADGLSVYFRDVTERRRAEEALRLANARLDLALRGSNIIIVELNIPGDDLQDGRWEWVSAGDQVGGYDRSEVATDFAATMARLHPDDRERVLGALQAHLSGQTREFEAEGRILYKDGSYRWRLVRGAAVRDAEGRAIRFMMSAVDITDLKRAEEALRASEAWFRFMANTMPQIVWTARPDGSPEYLNDRFAEYTGLPVAEVTGERWLSVLHPDDRERTMTIWMGDVAKGSDHDIEYRIRSADGRHRWFKSRGLPVRDESGLIVKWLGTITDIDDQKRAQEALREAKEAAEAASRAKDEFLANVSHEIRTPMNAILGMTELALDTPLTGEQREYLAIVKSSADALLKVINDLLDFAKIEAGKLELDHADFSLRHVLGETLRALALRAHRKGLELACRIQPEVPDALIGDAGRLRQVLLNLVGNAIKFTEQGEVVVRVEAGVEPTSTEPDPSVPGPQPSLVLHFAISDTGIGIPWERQEKIFRAFEQGDNSTTRRYEGTGLGLSIAARLVALMGGQIAVESEPGRGSTFRFTAGFGLQPAPAGGPHERPLVDLHGLRVLVVDDNATNRQILEEWLRGWHTEPLAVADGFKALDALWSAVSFGRPFALVLLDARMPGTDGLAVAESILQNPVLSTCRVILLTSEDMHGDIARYRELGIAACAMKPVPQEELLEIIYRVLSRPDSADAAAGRMDPVASAAPTATSARRLRILVAEDNPFNQQLVEHLLRRGGHDTRVASDGHEALAALGQDSFDLMFLDVHMPRCDGFQVIEALRKREQATGVHLPVIALTARAMQSDRERCLQAGMDDYLAKPIAAAELFRVMDRVLECRPAAEPEPPALGRPETLLDAATLLAACDDDPTLLRELIQVFRADAPRALARVSDAVDRESAPRLREAAHALRGLFSTFSTTAAKVAARLEAMGAGGQLDDAASTLADLSEMMERLGPLLEDISIEQLRHQAAGGGPV
jgi:two-component system sensor histidine kinase/response regulator